MSDPVAPVLAAIQSGTLSYEQYLTLKQGMADYLNQGTGDNCPVCALPAPHHGALPHLVAEERAAAGYVPCGCDPDAYDGHDPCVRASRHAGVCVAVDPASTNPDPDVVAQARRANPTGLAVRACREDMGTPHPVVDHADQIVHVHHHTVSMSR